MCVVFNVSIEILFGEGDHASERDWPVNHNPCGLAE
jgi:hypothetical protein